MIVGRRGFRLPRKRQCMLREVCHDCSRAHGPSAGRLGPLCTPLVWPAPTAHVSLHGCHHLVQARHGGRAVRPLGLLRAAPRQEPPARGVCRGC